MARKKSKQIQIDIPDSDNRRGGMSIAQAILTMGIIAGGIWWISGIISKSNSQQAAAELSTDGNANLASQIHFQIGKWYQSSNTDAILAIAKQIKDWPGVVRAYAALYQGDNVEAALQSAFSNKGGADGYKKFLDNLAYKGQPQNKSGTGVTKPIVTALTPNVSRVLLDSSRYQVQLFRNISDYPGTPYIIYPIGTVMNAAGNIFIQAQEFNYVGSTIKTTLYQIKLLNGTLVWINRDRNIIHKAN